MTFPTPFDEGPPPGWEELHQSQVEDSSAVQAVASKLLQAGLEAQEKDKRQLATGIKQKLVRPAMKEQKADWQRMTAISQQLRQAGEVAQGDDDAALMLLASRLQAATPTSSSTSSVTASPVVTVSTAPLPVTTPPAAGTCWPDPSRPGCYFCYDGTKITSWCEGQPLPGTPPLPDPDPIVMPPPIPIPPPVPPTPAPAPAPVPYCEPCPVGIPPGGPLPDASGGASCGPPPDDSQTARVYLQPWVSVGADNPSAFSECGRRMMDEAQYTLVPARPIADAVSREMGYADVVPVLDDGSLDTRVVPSDIPIGVQ